MKRIAFYGGSFDPVHNGHLSIARALLVQFELDVFVFLPAFHAPHKSRRLPTSAYDRFAMLCLVTRENSELRVSKIEVEAPERPYSVETLARLKTELPDDHVFFVMGADSWQEITTWREWEKVLGLCDQIVVTRPGYDIDFSHVTDSVRQRITDLRGGASAAAGREAQKLASTIYITDAVELDISATDIRHKIKAGDDTWRSDVPAEVANYIEKYQIYN